MNKGIKRLGIAVTVIGVLIAMIGGFSCGFVGAKSGHWLEFVMSILFCLIGGIICYAGGEISALGKKQ